MKRLLSKILFMALFTSACALHSTTIFAQSLPQTLHVTFDARPAGENIVQYKLTLDGTTDFVLPANACQAGQRCDLPFQVTSYGPHSIALVSQNQDLSGDTEVMGALQSSQAKVINFTLNPPPGSSGQPKVGK